MKIKYAMPNNPRIVSKLNDFPFGCGDVRAFLDIARELDNLNKYDSNFWYVDPDLYYQQPPAEMQKNDVVFYKGDEHYRLPPWHKECKVMLKQTATNKFPDNIIHIPFLYVTDFIKYPYIKFKDRKIDVLFTGTCWPETNRKYIIEYLKSKLNGLNIIFSEYINTKEYSYLLANSKISLCLDGKWTPECARFSESIQAGCVVLSSDLSYSSIFDDCPYVKVDWKNLEDIVDKIYSYTKDERSNDLSCAAKVFWQEKWHPKKWAELIVKKYDNS